MNLLPPHKHLQFHNSQASLHDPLNLLQCGSAERTGNLIFVNPCIQTLSMKHVRTVAKLFDLVTFLYIIQAYSAYQIIFITVFFHFGSSDGIAIFHDRQGAAFNQCCLDLDWGCRKDGRRSVVHWKNIVCGIWIGRMSFFCWVEQTQVNKCLF